MRNRKAFAAVMVVAFTVTAGLLWLLCKPELGFEEGVPLLVSDASICFARTLYFIYEDPPFPNSQHVRLADYYYTARWVGDGHMQVAPKASCNGYVEPEALRSPGTIEMNPPDEARIRIGKETTEVFLVSTRLGAGMYSLSYEDGERHVVPKDEEFNYANRVIALRKANLCMTLRTIGSDYIVETFNYGDQIRRRYKFDLGKILKDHPKGFSVAPISEDRISQDGAASPQ